MSYAEAAGAELLVVHAGRLDGGTRALRRLARRAGEGSVRIAIENAAPHYPGLSRDVHDPSAVGDLIRRLDCEEVGMCLDIGHAHIAADGAGRELAEVIAPLLDLVAAFAVHDNFGSRSGAQRAGGIEPMRVDLHLAPGAGSVPWASLAPLIACHPAPIVLEVHPAQRPVPGTLAVVMRELLGLSAPQICGA